MADDIKRCAEIRAALRRLMLESYPPDFGDELCRIAVELAENPSFMKAMLDALNEAWPENFSKGLSNSTLPYRRRRQAIAVAIYKMNAKVSQEEFCKNSSKRLERDLDPREFRRWLERYEKEESFRSLVDQIIASGRTL